MKLGATLSNNIVYHNLSIVEQWEEINKLSDLI